MIKVDPFFKPVTVSLTWARKSIELAQTAIYGFFLNPKHTEQFTSFDKRTGMTTLKVRLLAEIPCDYHQHVSEALMHTKHAFDQIIHAGCDAIGKPIEKSSYPWATNPTQLEGRFKQMKMPTEFQELIRIQAPYASNPDGRGDTFIRDISTIINKKHDLGIKVAASADVRDIELRLPTASIDILMGQWNCLSKEIDILRWRGDIGSGQGFYKVSYCAALDAPGELGNTPADVSALGFLHKAEIVCESFKLRCEEISSDGGNKAPNDGWASHAVAATDWRSRFIHKPGQNAVHPPVRLEELTRVARSDGGD